MRRTVKLSFSPRPLWPMTTPAKTCVRSLSPSLTRVWTLTESPTRNGTCFLICSPSIFSISFIRVLGWVFERLLRGPGYASFLSVFQKVGPQLLGHAPALLAVPFLDVAVI